MKRSVVAFGLAIFLAVAALSSGAQARTVITFAGNQITDAGFSGELWRQAIERFNAGQQEIRVEVVELPGSPNDQATKLLTMIAGGVPPDVIQYHAALVESFIAQGVLADISGYARRDPGFDLNDFFIPPIDFYYRRNGRLYGLPMQMQVYALFYNRDMLDAAGVRRPPTAWDDPGWNWDTFIEAGRKLTKDTDGDARVDQYAIIPRLDVTGGLLTYIWQSGGDVFDPSGTNLIIDSTESMRGIQYVIDLRHRYGVAPLKGIAAPFPLKSAFSISVPAGVPAMRKGQTAWDVAPLPRGPVAPATILGTTAMGMTAASHHPEAAWKFFKFMTSGETLTQFLQGGDHVPARRSLIETNVFRSIDNPPSFEVFVNSVPFGRKGPVHPNWPQISSHLQQAVNRAYDGEADIKTALSEVRPAVVALLRGAK